jgi:hypothetical protein
MNQYKKGTQMTMLKSIGAPFGFGHTDSPIVSCKQTLFAGITISETFEVLEPYDGKLSSTVLRGEEGRKPLALPGADDKN